MGLGSFFKTIMGGGGTAAGAGLLGGGLGAIGIGALIGGLGAKSRGGNFLKGALTGAALGGVTGSVGQRLGGAGGLFGWGSNKWGNLLPAAGIFMGSEMAGQGEANRLALEGRRRLSDEEEERRIARLSQMAGYDVADSSNFMTPQSYFGSEGGMAARPHYQLAGPVSMDDDPANAVDIQGLQMDPGTMSPGGLTEEFDYMDEASVNPEIQKLYKAFLVANQATEEEVPVEMFMTLMQQAGGQEAMMAARGGRVQMRGGGTPDDYDDDEIRYDDELLDILEEGPAMFHGDYDVADEWKGGGIAAVPRQNFLFGGLTALAKLARKGKASDFAEFTEKETIEDTGEGPSFEEFTEKETIKDTGASGFIKRSLEDVSGEGSDLMNQLFDDQYTDYPEQVRNLLGLIHATKKTGEKDRLLADTIKHSITEQELTREGDQLLDIAKLYQENQDAEGFRKFLENVYNENMGDTGATGFMKRAVGDITEDVDMGWMDNMSKAKGGIADLDLRGGGASVGPGTGTSDDIPAMLSDGEFVVTANAVKNLGGGDRMEGARRMYSMMNQLDPQSQAPAEMNYVGRG